MTHKFLFEFDTRFVSSVSLSGKEFHSETARQWRVLWPVAVLYPGMSILFLFCVSLLWISDLFLNLLAGQSGANPLKHLKTSMLSLQISMDSKDNHFSSVRTGVMCSNFCKGVIILAVKFWTFCNLLIFFFVVLDQMDKQVC